ncbi:hypothetical protein M569_02720 [Genlisea aurea]|uniref:DDE-1 domain-containing protein n=1 Tax=Genlisea aurea TaxID=192259 RepID=S8E859_9LAMI|nr:hypothetical protein M569_02720 [Genlisea aurea]
MEVLKFAKTHSNAETLRQFPEVSASTLTRIKRNETIIRKAAEKGKQKQKRVKNHLRKYQALGEAFHKFFLCVRDAHGGVSRNLLEVYALTMPEDVVKDFHRVNKSSKDIFWQRWRQMYHVVYRRVSGIKQYVPGDFEKRVEDYKSLLRSMHKEREYREFVCGDETGVRMEEIGGTTLETQGTKHVHIASGGGDKTMFTTFLASRLVVDGNGDVVSIKKEAPLILFKGAEKGKIQKEIAKAAQESEFQCTVATTANGWQTGETFLAWLKDHIRAKKKTLLVVDLYAAHRDSLTRTWLKDSGVDILYIPGGCTNILQVMDVYVNAVFKKDVRNQYMQWKADEIRAERFSSKPSRENVIEWVLQAWDKIPDDLLLKGMTKLILEPAMNDELDSVAAEGALEGLSDEAVAEEEVGGLLELLNNLDLSETTREEEGAHLFFYFSNHQSMMTGDGEQEEREGEEDNELGEDSTDGDWGWPEERNVFCNNKDLRSNEKFGICNLPECRKGLWRKRFGELFPRQDLL